MRAVVKFINTDGMAFIGPGSEWFWTAVSGIILVVTFIAIYRQLRLQANASAIEELEAFDREANSERANRYALAILVALRDGTDPADIPEAAYGYTFDSLERFAILYRTGRRNVKLLAQRNTLAAQGWWAMLAPRIRRGRDTFGDPGIGANLEWLAGVMAEADRRAGVKAFTPASISGLINGWIAETSEKIRVEQALRTVILAPADESVVVSPPAVATPADVPAAAAAPAM
jgi:hypothetical protein